MSHETLNETTGELTESQAVEPVAETANVASASVEDMRRLNSIAVDTLNAGANIADNDLSEINSVDDVRALFTSTGDDLEDVSDYGTGFELLENKDRLVGTPFIIIEWRFNNGDNGTFVSAYVITDDGRKFIFNDGSSGVCRQLFNATEKRLSKEHPNPRRGLKCSRGLRKHEYDRKDPVTREPLKDAVTGKVLRATTYHLA